MANNVQSAADWQDAIDTLDQMKKGSLTQANGVKDIIQNLSDKGTTLASQLRAADEKGDTGLKDVIQGQIDANNSRLSGAKLALGNIEKDIAQFDADLNKAGSQYAAAQEGPPGALSTPPPAEPVAKTPTSPIPTTEPATGDTSVVVGGPIANSAGPIEQKTVLDNGRDPYVNVETGQTTIPTIESQRIPDDATFPPKYGDPPASPLKEVPAKTEKLADGSTVQTFADGSTLTTDKDGNQAFNTAGQTPYVDGSNADTAYVSPVTAQSQQLSRGVIEDWRIKLKLASGVKYLYNAADKTDILYPLKLSNGVVFPYTPTIQTAYRASYDPTDLAHSNYRMYFYKNSYLDDISITAEFTAQDSAEACYMLAVMHFFKSVTKMFYGKDDLRGTPPPLMFLEGYGQYQYNKHPLLISSFAYTLPNDVDYIRATTNSGVRFTANPGANAQNAAYNPGLDFVGTRLLGANLNKGGVSDQPVFTLIEEGVPTYVPTKLQMTITCLPVVARNDISNNFSLTEYATGKLTKRPTGGIW